MSRPRFASADQVGGLLVVLEWRRLELLEEAAAREKYTEADVEKLSLYGAAIQSVKDAIAFGKEVGAWENVEGLPAPRP